MILFFSFVFGTVLGSFLNVCIYRLPLHQSVVFPGSHCCSCKKAIAFYDTVPLLSFLILRGSCRYCKAAIPYRYPLVELLTGMLSLSCMLKWGLGFPYAVSLAFCAALVVVTFIDLEHQIIPDSISLPGILCGLAVSPLMPFPGFVDSLLGALLGGGSLLAIAGGYYLLTRQEGMGLGDVKLLAMMGAFLGWRSILFIIMVGSLSGSLVGLTVMLRKKKDRRYAIPFGPFLSLGALSYLFYGQEIIFRYSQFQGWIGNIIG